MMHVAVLLDCRMHLDTPAAALGRGAAHEQAIPSAAMKITSARNLD
jgi:hypothetical protein